MLSSQLLVQMASLKTRSTTFNLKIQKSVLAEGVEDWELNFQMYRFTEHKFNTLHHVQDFSVVYTSRKVINMFPLSLPYQIVKIISYS